jgi:hypothetical protein
VEAIGSKDQHDNPIADHRGEVSNKVVVSRIYYWPCMNEEIAHFVKISIKCQMNQTSYRKQVGLLQELRILPKS